MRIRTFFVLSLLLLPGTGLWASWASAADDVLSVLNAIPGVQATETTAPEDVEKSLRRFAITFKQPADHFDPQSPLFEQHLVLFHRGFEEPMVLETSGYEIYYQGLSRVAEDFGTNQLQVEHRFYGNSFPQNVDWRLLSVRQSAWDFHRISQAFRAVYTAKWVATGNSKGGMTSIYHRRFFPNDLDGTIANVAPLSFSPADKRYVRFVERVGGAKYAGCRTRIKELQSILLDRREGILPEIEGSYTVLGGKEVAFEHAVIELPFSYWQYTDPTDEEVGCDHIPGASASTEELAEFLKITNHPDQFSDAEFPTNHSYIYQAQTELGSPDINFSYIASQLVHPYTMEQYLPPGVTTSYTPAVMLDIKEWVKKNAERIMFVYGEFDPYTAGAFRKINNKPGTDNHWYLIRGGNHIVDYHDLPMPQQTAALGVLTRWLGKAPIPQTYETRTFVFSKERRLRKARIRRRL